MRRAAPHLAVAVLLATTTACGAVSGGVVPAAPPPPTATSAAPAIPGGPPAITVRGDGEAVQLQPWTWCSTSGCADGMRPADPADVGGASELVVTFPEPGWTFQASFRPSGEPCGRSQTVDVERTGTTEHRVRPAGPAGTYDVDIFGSGPRGDAVATVRWTTPVQGVMPTPSASAAVLADHDGVADSYGVELLLDDLAATPAQATAAITVTSAQGRSTTIEPTSAAVECGEDGLLFFTAPVEQGRQAAALGTGPFTYDVDVVLDGVRHSATATWPDDELSDHSSSVGLVFDPPLPALEAPTPAG